MRLSALPLFCLLACAGSVAAQETALAKMAGKLKADLAKVLPASSLSADLQSRLLADADVLVANAQLRATGGSPDRSKGRAAAQEIGTQASHLGAAAGQLIKDDLKALQDASR